MDRMFLSCSSLMSLDLSKFETPKLMGMEQMFNGCKNLESIVFSTDFDTSQVTNFRQLFAGNIKLTSLELSTFNTQKVTDMSILFDNCNSLEYLNIKGWDTSKVTNMRQMFSGCKALKELDVSKLETGQVKEMFEMFKDCGTLKTLDVSNFDTKMFKAWGKCLTVATFYLLYIFKNLILKKLLI